jgi:CRISPR-associated protein Cmr1
MPNSTEAEFQIVTPLFMGGATTHAKPDAIRPPAFKGALRFWWRALEWGNSVQQHPSDQAKALHDLHRREARLFGSAAHDGNPHSGQSQVLLSIRHQPITDKDRDQSWPSDAHKNSAAAYLGYGLLKDGNQPHRTSLNENLRFQVRLHYKKGVTQGQIESVEQALQALSLFGGLGARARRGFGSIQMTRLNREPQTCANWFDYNEAATKLIQHRGQCQELPPFSAFSARSRFRVLHGAPLQSAKQALGEIGRLYKEARDKSNPAGPLFEATRELVPMGLPLTGVDSDSRRASPFLFHIHSIANGASYVPGILFLPALFHPEKYPEGNQIEFFKKAEQALMGSNA